MEDWPSDHMHGECEQFEGLIIGYEVAGLSSCEMKMGMN